MGMIIDNPESYFYGLSKKERIKAVLTQFIRDDEEKLNFCTDNIWELIEKDYFIDDVPNGLE